MPDRISASSDGERIGASLSDPQAFGALFDRHARVIWRYAAGDRARRRRTR